MKDDSVQAKLNDAFIKSFRLLNARMCVLIDSEGLVVARYVKDEWGDKEGYVKALTCIPLIVKSALDKIYKRHSLFLVVDIGDETNVVMKDLRIDRIGKLYFIGEVSKSTPLGLVLMILSNLEKELDLVLSAAAVKEVKKAEAENESIKELLKALEEHPLYKALFSR